MGNGFINDAQMNCVNPYSLSPSNHVFMEMERWPEGSYGDVKEGLNTFRAYVMERLAQMDLYYEELELSHDEDRTGYKLSLQIQTFSNLSYYLEALFYTEYTAIVEINTPAIWGGFFLC